MNNKYILVNYSLSGVVNFSSKKDKEEIKDYIKASFEGGMSGNTVQLTKEQIVAGKKIKVFQRNIEFEVIGFHMNWQNNGVNQSCKSTTCHLTDEMKENIRLIIPAGQKIYLNNILYKSVTGKLNCIENPICIVVQ